MCVLWHWSWRYDYITWKSFGWNVFQVQNCNKVLMPDTIFYHAGNVSLTWEICLSKIMLETLLIDNNCLKYHPDLSSMEVVNVANKLVKIYLCTVTFIWMMWPLFKVVTYLQDINNNCVQIQAGIKKLWPIFDSNGIDRQILCKHNKFLVIIQREFKT